MFGEHSLASQLPFGKYWRKLEKVCVKAIFWKISDFQWRPHWGGKQASQPGVKQAHLCRASNSGPFQKTDVWLPL